MLAQLIHCEAGSESMTGKIAVGNVVMNRVLCNGSFGSSVTDVITAQGQFAAYSLDISPSVACVDAAQKVLNDQVWVVPQNTYYYNTHQPEGEDWGAHRFYTRIGSCNFYTHDHDGRSNSNTIPAALFERAYQWPQYGCKPEDRVLRVQFLLTSFGCNVAADGYFGVETMNELMKFQEKHGLDISGIADPPTIEKLISEFGIEKYHERFYT